jgi:hypothetical protein
MATGIGQYGFGFKSWRYADAGKYFSTTIGATPGTGIISGVTTALVNTTPYILFYNGNTVASGIKCYFDFLFLHCTVIGASESRLEMTMQVDPTQGVNPYTSGASLMVQTNPNSDSSNASAAVVRVGAVVCVAAANRNVAHYTMSTAIPLVEDQWSWDFGGSGGFHGGGNVIADSASTGHHRQFPAPPIIVGPGESARFNTWGAAMGTGVTFAGNLSWVEV